MSGLELWSPPRFSGLLSSEIEGAVCDQMARRIAKLQLHQAAVGELPNSAQPLPEAPSPLTEPTSWPARLPPMTVLPFERDEIKQRLANFKAHQLRMQAEREDFYVQTMARTRAVIESSPASKKMKRGTVL